MARKKKAAQADAADAHDSAAAPPEDKGQTAGERPFFGRIKDAWRGTVGAYATDDDETRNLAKRLVEFGTLTAEEAKQLLSLATIRGERNRKEIDEQVDASIKRAASRLTVPSPEEIRQINRRVAEVESRIAALEKRKRARSSPGRGSGS
jgi:polyhydroxyalkanoate synthesis regulator phasin